MQYYVTFMKGFSMKQSFVWIILLCITSCFSFAFGQDTTSLVSTDTQHRPWTLEFGVSSNFTLTSFQGTTISLGRYISDHEKIRFGANISMTTQRSENESFYYDTLGGAHPYGTANSYISNSIRLSLQYLSYETPYENIAIYFGVGPVAGYSYSRYDASYPWSYQYTAGVVGSFGAEWFFSKKLSLHAEYGLNATYAWTRSESETSKSTTKSFGIGGQSVLFGLSVHF
jgi:hypothetical protein